MKKEKEITRLQRRISVLQENENKLSKQKSTVEEQLHQKYLEAVGATTEQYFAPAAKRIYEFAVENDLDPHWFYKEIQDPAEFHLTVASFSEPTVTEPKTAEEFCLRAVQVLGRNKGGWGSHFSPIVQGQAEKDFKRAVELSEKENDKRRIAYQWLHDNIGFLDDVYHRHFRDHY